MFLSSHLILAAVCLMDQADCPMNNPPVHCFIFTHVQCASINHTLLINGCDKPRQSSVTDVLKSPNTDVTATRNMNQ